MDWENSFRRHVDQAMDAALASIDRERERLGLTDQQVYEWLQTAYGFDWADAWAGYRLEDADVSPGQKPVST